MASLFDMGQTPQYVAPGGTALVTKTQGGLLGLFPGTPEYARPELPASPPVPSPAPISTVPVTITAPSEVEVRVSIPGVVSVQGTLIVQPAVAAALLGLAREVLEREAAKAATTDEDAAEEPAKPVEAAARVSEIEQRVWDRE